MSLLFARGSPVDLIRRCSGTICQFSVTIADAIALTSLHATVYKFELQLIKQDQWLLQQVNWHPASLVDMQ